MGGKLENKLNVVMVFSWPIYNQRGGAEKIMCELSNELVRRGHSVTVFSSDRSLGKPVYPIDEGVKFVYFGGKKISFLHSKIFNKLKSFSFYSSCRKALRKIYQLDAGASQLRQCLTKVNADCYIAYSCDSAYLLKKAINQDVQIVMMYHTAPEFDYGNVFSVDPEGGPRGLKHYRMSRAMDAYNGLISKVRVIQVLMPEFVSQVQKKYPGVRVVYIPNAVSQFKRPALLENPVIINVARLVSIKRQHLIVQAFFLLKDKFPEWTVEIWGQDRGQYSDEIKQMVNELGLEDRVKICGSTNNVEEQLERASIVLMTSSVEGFCLGMVEAMAKGIPAVGCERCPAVNSIIRNGENGFLCDDTPDGIANTLAKLMSDMSLRRRLGSQAREDAKIYEPQRIWNKWESLLKSLKNS